MVPRAARERSLARKIVTRPHPSMHANSEKPARIRASKGPQSAEVRRKKMPCENTNVTMKRIRWKGRHEPEVLLHYRATSRRPPSALPRDWPPLQQLEPVPTVTKAAAFRPRSGVEWQRAEIARSRKDRSTRRGISFCIFAPPLVSRHACGSRTMRLRFVRASRKGTLRCSSHVNALTSMPSCSSVAPRTLGPDAALNVLDTESRVNSLFSSRLSDRNFCTGGWSICRFRLPSDRRHLRSAAKRLPSKAESVAA